MSKNSFVTVKIFGNEYRVRGDGGEDEIRDIARYVDSLMRDISVSGRHSSETRIAILAAFNIAAELHQQRRSGGGDGDSEKKAAMLLELLSDDFLEEKPDADADA